MKIALKKTIAIPKVCWRFLKKLTDGESKVAPPPPKQTNYSTRQTVFQ